MDPEAKQYHTDNINFVSSTPAPNASKGEKNTAKSTRWRYIVSVVCVLAAIGGTVALTVLLYKPVKTPPCENKFTASFGKTASVNCTYPKEVFEESSKTLMLTFHPVSQQLGSTLLRNMQIRWDGGSCETDGVSDGITISCGHDDSYIVTLTVEKVICNLIGEFELVLQGIDPDGPNEVFYRDRTKLTIQDQTTAPHLYPTWEHQTEGENDSLSLFQITGKQDTGCSPPDIRFLGLLESGSSFRLQKVDIKSNTKYSKDKGYITTFEANVTSDIVEGLLDVIVTAGEVGDNHRSSFQSSVKCAKKPNESYAIDECNLNQRQPYDSEGRVQCRICTRVSDVNITWLLERPHPTQFENDTIASLQVIAGSRFKDMQGTDNETRIMKTADLDDGRLLLELVFKSLRCTDEGLYTAVITTKDGDVEDSFNISIYLSVTDQPYHCENVDPMLALTAGRKGKYKCGICVAVEADDTTVKLEMIRTFYASLKAPLGLNVTTRGEVNWTDTDYVTVEQTKIDFIVVTLDFRRVMCRDDGNYTFTVKRGATETSKTFHLPVKALPLVPEVEVTARYNALVEYSDIKEHEQPSILNCTAFTGCQRAPLDFRASQQLGHFETERDMASWINDSSIGNWSVSEKWTFPSNDSETDVKYRGYFRQDDKYGGWFSFAQFEIKEPQIALHNREFTCSYTYEPLPQLPDPKEMRIKYKAEVIPAHFCSYNKPPCDLVHPYHCTRFIGCSDRNTPVEKRCPYGPNYPLLYFKQEEECTGKCTYANDVNCPHA